jgi:5-methylcytosine-specific restriction endonuclease McrA
MSSNDQTLLLSHAYEPVKVIPWQRALTLLFLNKVEIVEEYDEEIRSPSYVIKIPAVARLLRAFKRFRKPVKFSRVNIYARDRYTCQYCGESKPTDELTYDHVLPRAQGGLTEWTNIVTCCVDCNGFKANRTPEQAKMKLLNKPVRPEWVPAMTISVSRRSLPAAWRDYLYWTEELEAT